MKAKAIELGVEFTEGTVVGGDLSLCPNSSTEYTLNAVKVEKKNSKDVETIQAGNFVNAAGACGGLLVDLLSSNLVNAKGIKRVPVVPKKRCVFVFDCQIDSQTSNNIDPVHQNDNYFDVPPSTTPLVLTLVLHPSTTP